MTYHVRKSMKKQLYSKNVQALEIALTAFLNLMKMANLKIICTRIYKEELEMFPWNLCKLLKFISIFLNGLVVWARSPDSWGNAW